MKKIILSLLLTVVGCIPLLAQPWKDYNANAYKFNNNEAYLSIRKKNNDNLVALDTSLSKLGDTLNAHNIRVNGLSTAVGKLKTDKIKAYGTPTSKAFAYWENDSTVNYEDSVTNESNYVNIKKVGGIRFGSSVGGLYTPRIFREGNSFKFVDSSSYANGYTSGYSLDDLFSSGAGDIDLSTATNYGVLYESSDNIGTNSKFLYRASTLFLQASANDTAEYIYVPSDATYGQYYNNASSVGGGIYMYNNGYRGIDIRNTSASSSAIYINPFSKTGIEIGASTPAGVGIGLTLSSSAVGMNFTTANTAYGIMGLNASSNPSVYLANSGSATNEALRIDNLALAGYWGIKVVASTNAGGGILSYSESTGGTPLMLQNYSTYATLDLRHYGQSKGINITTAVVGGIPIDVNTSTTNIFTVYRDTIEHHVETFLDDTLRLKYLDPINDIGYLYMIDGTTAVKVDSSALSASEVLKIKLPFFFKWFNDRKDGELKWYNPNTKQWEYGIDNNLPKEADVKLLGGIELLSRYVNILTVSLIIIVLFSLGGFIYLFREVKKLNK